MATFTATVTSGDVAATLTNYPAYIDLSEMPTSFWSTVVNGGGDIRVYSDAGLTTEMAREVVSCDTSDDTGELHTLVASLTTSTVLYITVDGTSSEPSAGSTYGSEAVWADYEFVSHHKNLTDSTGKHSLTQVGGVTAGGATGKISEGTHFDGSNDSLTDTGTTFGAKNDFSVQSWIKLDTFGGTSIVVNHDGLGYSSYDFGLFAENDGSIKLTVCTGSSASVYKSISSAIDEITTGSFIKVTGTRSGVNGALYKNGVSIVTSTGLATGATNNLSMFGIGKLGTYPTAFFDGIIDETRVAKFRILANWETTEYNNQSDVAGFWTIAEAAGGATFIAKTAII